MLVEMRDLEAFERDQGLGVYDAIIGAIAGVLGAGMQVGGAIVGAKGQEKIDAVKAQTEEAKFVAAMQRAPYERAVMDLEQEESSAKIFHVVKVAGMVGGTVAGLYLINKAMK